MQGKKGTLIAAQVEFLDVAERMLKEKKPVNMAELERLYINILEENLVEAPLSSRKVLKQLLADEIWGIEFHKPPRMNESERVSTKETRDASILSMEEHSLTSEMKCLYETAALLRKRINSCKQWEFKGTFDNINDSQLPNELCCFFRWIIQGPKDFTSGRF